MWLESCWLNWCIGLFSEYKSKIRHYNSNHATQLKSRTSHCCCVCWSICVASVCIATPAVCVCRNPSVFVFLAFAAIVQTDTLSEWQTSETSHFNATAHNRCISPHKHISVLFVTRQHRNRNRTATPIIIRILPNISKCNSSTKPILNTDKTIRSSGLKVDTALNLNAHTKLRLSCCQVCPCAITWLHDYNKCPVKISFYSKTPEYLPLSLILK